MENKNKNSSTTIIILISGIFFFLVIGLLMFNYMKSSLNEYDIVNAKIVEMKETINEKNEKSCVVYVDFTYENQLYEHYELDFYNENMEIDKEMELFFDTRIGKIVEASPSMNNTINNTLTKIVFSSLFGTFIIFILLVKKAKGKEEQFNNDFGNDFYDFR